MALAEILLADAPALQVGKICFLLGTEQEALMMSNLDV